MQNKNAGMVFVTGKRGSGKSTYIKARIKKSKRIIVFDPMEEYKRELGFPQMKTVAELKKYLIKNWNKGFKVSFMPKKGMERQYLHEVSKFIMAAQQPYNEGKDSRMLDFVVEEMNNCYPLKAEQDQKNWGFMDVCSRGRHHGVNVWGASQRISEVSTNFRGNLDYHIIFAVSSAVDLNSMVRELGKASEAEIKALKPHNYLKLESFNVTKGKNKLDRRPM